MVPNGWSKQKISNILEKVVIPVKPIEGTYYREIGIRSHGKGIFHKEKVTSFEIGNKRVFEVIENAFVVNIVFAWEQAIAKTTYKELGFIASHRFPQFLPKDARCDIDYLVYFFNTLNGKYLLGLASPGGAGRNKTLGQKEFDLLELNLPPLPEQRKIAKILIAWDRGIATTEKLIDASKQQKKALMQQLLTGKKRLRSSPKNGAETGKAFEGEGKEVRLEKCLSLMRSGLSRKLENENIGVAVIRSNNIGARFTSNNDLKYWYWNDPQGAKVENYILDNGDILVNFINSLSQIGKTCIYRKNNGLDAIYTTNILRLKVNKKIVVSEFLFYLTKTERYRNAVQSITKPAVNQASFTTKEFGSIKLMIPPLKEQQKIASVLTAADKEIELLQAKLAHFKQEKKALMQQLLTGKRRVFCAE